MNIETTTNFCTSLFYWIWITGKFHVLLKWNQDNKNKICCISKQNLWFSTTKIPTTILIVPKLCV
jgi:hypothetical protein